jgi:hypothetical protein
MTLPIYNTRKRERADTDLRFSEKDQGQLISFWIGETRIHKEENK